VSLTAEQLYALLPAVHRRRDADLGGPLAALVAVLAAQGRVVEADIEGLYENWFLETCEEWVVPYLGDLLGVRGLHAIAGAGVFSQAPYAANTLGYRRRKGTAVVLQQLARDTTGWNARAVEFFALLETTQHMNHVRRLNFRTPDLRQTAALELVDTAFDSAAHSLDVRHIATRGGRHDIPSLGLFLWRLQHYLVDQATASAAASPADGRYRFSPLGDDATLFNRPQTEAEITRLAGEENVPGMLRRLPLYRDLEAVRQAVADGGAPRGVYFGADPVLQVLVPDQPGGKPVAIPSQEVLICHLGDPSVAIPEVWRRPPKTKRYQPSDGSPPVDLPIRVAVDPVLGRLAFPTGDVPAEVRVSYHYGFSGDAGAGPYNRRGSPAAAPLREVTWQAAVGRDAKPVNTPPEPVFADLESAIAAWNGQPVGTAGIIAMLDSLTYAPPAAGGWTGAGRIKVPARGQLLIAAADWPVVPVPGGAPGQTQRIVGQLTPRDRRPHLRGDLEVEGDTLAGGDAPSELILDGLLVEGKLTVRNGKLGSLQVTHSTLVPAAGGISVAAGNAKLKLHLGRALCGPIALPAAGIAELSTATCVVDAPASESDPTALAAAAAGTPAVLTQSTFFGGVKARQLEASECLFTLPVVAERLQTGCVRFSHVPAGSRTPRRYRCQPDLALQAVPAAAAAAVRARLAPSFTSLHYGDPGYSQLQRTAAVELRTGAEDGSEMGVWSFLEQPQREANLTTALGEYLHFGLEAGLIFVT
jgi:hypothetical protein